MMIIDSQRPITPRKPIDAFLMTEDDDGSLFPMYLQFLLFRIQSDAGSYRQAIKMATGKTEKKVLSSMAAKKEKMHDILISCNQNRSNNLLDSASYLPAGYSMADFILDTDFRPFMTMIDAFLFAYRKECDSLFLFEKVSRMKLSTSIRVIMYIAIEHQQQHILYLDDSLRRSSGVTNTARVPLYNPRHP